MTIRMSQTVLSSTLQLADDPHPRFCDAKARQWQPQACRHVLHEEIFAGAEEASGVGMALALAREELRYSSPGGKEESGKAVLWVQDRAALRLGGRPYYHGLPKDLRGRLIHVAAVRPEDALFALEEGLNCRDMAFVIGEIAGNPKALDFTASRRLSLATERYGVPLYLVRLGAERDLSSARMRWTVQPVRSLAPPWNEAAPGPASWQAHLFRSRGHLPGEWIFHDQGSALLIERFRNNGPSHDASNDPGDASPHSDDLAGAAGD